MKLRRIAVENVRSFLSRQELHLPEDISVLIGPNGGGKTNLLDAAVLATRCYLLRSWVARHSPQSGWKDRYDWIPNDDLQPHLLEKHSAGAELPQVIELEIEATVQDIANIKTILTLGDSLQEQSKSRYTSFPADDVRNWSLVGLNPGTKFTFTIQDKVLKVPTDPGANTLKRYLETYEVTSRLQEDLAGVLLSTPMLSLPVTRSGGGIMTTIALADFDEVEHKRNTDAASSRSGSAIASFAIARIARWYRNLLEDDNGQAHEKMKSDASIKSLTETLRILGYEWSLKCTNVIRNEYDVQIEKNGSTFTLGTASSGERALIVYVFSIYGLNIKDALIVIDEPELHLHPRWQRVMLTMFARLSQDTGNQFLMATHSPVFVSPDSIQYVSRIFSEGQQSRIVTLGDATLPNKKHLLGIVNSHNNERIFFSDLVILVEGISDRAFFESVFKKLELGKGTGTVYEIVSVGGKNLFKQYIALLTACKVRHVVIADKDYLREIGTTAIKGMFSTSTQNLKEKVIDDVSSYDAAQLVDALDQAIAAGSTERLRQLWEYIKGRQSRLRTDLSEEDSEVVSDFLATKRSEGQFLLSQGALEDYLPSGHRMKDLEKLIELLSRDFWEELPEHSRRELSGISEHLSRLLADESHF